MAKDNLFLGIARGSVGSVTFYRRNGEQISRVRSRSVRNPNTDGQLIQRAILATVSKAYAAGSVIFDHAFEGCKVGAECQAKFQQENLRYLRQVIMAELDNEPDACSAAVTSRGSAFPVANAFRVSSGSLIQNVFEVEEDSAIISVTLASAPETNEKVGEYCARLGIVANDIFTIVGFGIVDNDFDASSTDGCTRNYKTYFGFLRLKVKDSALSSTAAMSTADFDTIFEHDGTGRWGEPGIGDPFTIEDLVPGSVYGAIGVIRSRDNQDLRSTTNLTVPQRLIWGLTAPTILRAWNPDTAGNLQSPLILEGGNV